jgi:hypothetical protein
MRPRQSAPDWWEFARERCSVADSIIGRCFLHTVLNAIGAGARPPSPAADLAPVRRTRPPAERRDYFLDSGGVSTR